MMNKIKFLVYFLLIVGLFLVLRFREKNYYKIPAFVTDSTIHAIIEIPAGTNFKTEYNRFANTFANTEKRIVEFLPYPANYGFIPSTLADTARGGDGDPLDILVIAESIEMKTVVEVIPVAVLSMIDKGQVDDKIIAVPVNEEHRIIGAGNLNDLQSKYPEIQAILETWFSAYKQNDSLTILGWKNETEAIRLVNYWIIKP